MEKSIKIRILILLYIIILVCGVKTLNGQNLVPNPGFEQYDKCPESYTPENGKIQIPHWYSATKATPDYFNKCSKFNVNVPVNFMGHLWANEGNAYIGILCAEHPDDNKSKRTTDYREYIQVKLKNSLSGSKKYRIQFYYAVAPYSKFAVNSLGVCLSQQKIKARYSVIDCSGTYTGTDTSTVITEAGVWIRFSDTISVNGEEEYLTIGNFYSDRDMKYEPLDISELRNSLQETINNNGYVYYYIDNVLVETINE